MKISFNRLLAAGFFLLLQNSFAQNTDIGPRITSCAQLQSALPSINNFGTARVTGCQDDVDLQRNGPNGQKWFGVVANVEVSSRQDSFREYRARYPRFSNWISWDGAPSNDGIRLFENESRLNGIWNLCTGVVITGLTCQTIIPGWSTFHQEDDPGGWTGGFSARYVTTLAVRLDNGSSAPQPTPTPTAISSTPTPSPSPTPNCLDEEDYEAELVNLVRNITGGCSSANITKSFIEQKKELQKNRCDQEPVTPSLMLGLKRARTDKASYPDFIVYKKGSAGAEGCNTLPVHIALLGEFNLRGNVSDLDSLDRFLESNYFQCINATQLHAAKLGTLLEEGFVIRLSQAEAKSRKLKKLKIATELNALAEVNLFGKSQSLLDSALDSTKAMLTGKSEKEINALLKKATYEERIGLGFRVANASSVLPNFSEPLAEAITSYGDPMSRTQVCLPRNVQPEEGGCEELFKRINFAKKVKDRTYPTWADAERKEAENLPPRINRITDPIRLREMLVEEGYLFTEAVGRSDTIANLQKAVRVAIRAWCGGDLPPLVRETPVEFRDNNPKVASRRHVRAFGLETSRFFHIARMNGSRTKKWKNEGRSDHHTGQAADLSVDPDRSNAGTWTANFARFCRSIGICGVSAVIWNHRYVSNGSPEGEGTLAVYPRPGQSGSAAQLRPHEDHVHVSLQREPLQNMISLLKSDPLAFMNKLEESSRRDSKRKNRPLH